jgi:hypothetical protein
VSVDSQFALRESHVCRTSPLLSFQKKGGERCIPNQTARHALEIFSQFIKGIGEGQRWSGRTQSSASWSPEQLRHDLRLQLVAAGIGGQTDVHLRILEGIPTRAESSIGVGVGPN